MKKNLDPNHISLPSITQIELSFKSHSIEPELSSTSNYRPNHHIELSSKSRSIDPELCSSSSHALKKEGERQDTPSTHQCRECGKSYKQYSSLQRHIKKTHSGKNTKQHKCPHCPASFHSKYQLTVHNRTHTNERPYACKICPRKFRQNSHLLTHIRTHTKEKPYQCKECGKRFTQSSSVTTHMRIHRNIKPFACPHCLQQFTQKHSRDRHVSAKKGKCRELIRSNRLKKEKKAVKIVSKSIKKKQKTNVKLIGREMSKSNRIKCKEEEIEQEEGDKLSIAQLTTDHDLLFSSSTHSHMIKKEELDGIPFDFAVDLPPRIDINSDNLDYLERLNDASFVGDDENAPFFENLSENEWKEFMEKLLRTDHDDIADLAMLSAPNMSKKQEQQLLGAVPENDALMQESMSELDQNITPYSQQFGLSRSNSLCANSSIHSYASSMSSGGPGLTSFTFPDHMMHHALHTNNQILNEGREKKGGGWVSAINVIQPDDDDIDTFNIKLLPPLEKGDDDGNDPKDVEMDDTENIKEDNEATTQDIPLMFLCKLKKKDEEKKEECGAANTLQRNNSNNSDDNNSHSHSGNDTHMSYDGSSHYSSNWNGTSSTISNWNTSSDHSGGNYTMNTMNMSYDDDEYYYLENQCDLSMNTIIDCNNEDVRHPLTIQRCATDIPLIMRSKRRRYSSSTECVYGMPSPSPVIMATQSTTPIFGTDYYPLANNCNHNKENDDSALFTVSIQCEKDEEQDKEEEETEDDDDDDTIVEGNLDSTKRISTKHR
eukprot:927656_1